jgi:hypothetical protein
MNEPSERVEVAGKGFRHAIRVVDADGNGAEGSEGEGHGDAVVVVGIDKNRRQVAGGRGQESLGGEMRR